MSSEPPSTVGSSGETKQDEPAHQIVQRWISAMHGGRVTDARALLGDDVEFVFDSSTSLGGRRIGPDAVFQFFFTDLSTKAGMPRGGAAIAVLEGSSCALELYRRDVDVDDVALSARIGVLYEVVEGQIVKINFVPIDRSAFERMCQ